MNAVVCKNTVISLDYSVTDPDGAVLDEGREPLVYLHGGYGDIFEPIETALAGKTVGDSIRVKLQPEEAFGDYDESLVQIEPRSQFPEPIEVGMHFEGSASDTEADGETSDDAYQLYRVTDLADDKVVLDGNHPLAGMALVFSCTITSIRPASAAEIERGEADEPDDPSDDDAPMHH